MADFKENENPILKGSKHVITVEESTKDLIVVCLSYQKYVYRGVLLNSSIGNTPYGVHLPKPKDESERKDIVCDGFHNDMFSVSNRHSFLHVPGSRNTNNQQPPVTSVKKSWRDKTVRNIRLRPRQVLCSKCKSTCLENQEKGVAPKPIVIYPQAQIERPKVDISTKCNIHSKKRSLPESFVKLENIVIKKFKATDSTTSDTTSLGTKKRSPIIKISFNTPQGKGTVVKIPPKIQSQEASDSEYDACDGKFNENVSEISDNFEKSDVEKTPRGGRTPEYGSDIGIYGYKKVKKSLRKAKEKEPLKVTLKSLNSNAPQQRGHKKKHKVRHRKKHKHRRTLKDQEVPGNEIPDQENAIQIIENKDGIPMLENISFECKSPKHLQPDGIVTRLRRQRPNLGSENSESNNDHYVLSNGGNLSNRNLNNKSDAHEAYSTGGESPIDVERIDRVPPLMMRIHTRSVDKCMIGDSRYFVTGDIVWGKILGFPWWPGKIFNITVSQKDNGVIIRQMAHVSWFGSSTISNMPCCDLFPFLEDFSAKYNKKKRGPYKLAVKQATLAAKELHGMQPDDLVDVEGLDDV